MARNFPTAVTPRYRYYEGGHGNPVNSRHSREPRTNRNAHSQRLSENAGVARHGVHGKRQNPSARVRMMMIKRDLIVLHWNGMFRLHVQIPCFYGTRGKVGAEARRRDFGLLVCYRSLRRGRKEEEYNRGV